MARRKQAAAARVKNNQAKESTSGEPAAQVSSEQPKPAAMATAKRRRHGRPKGSRAKVRAVAKRRRPGRPKGSKNNPRVAAGKRAKRSARARHYTPAERRGILAAARREGLSGPAAAKKFGISQLSFYTWRKKAGAAKSRRVGRPKGTRTRSGTTISRGIDGVLRQEIRVRISQMLPEIIRGEIDSILGHSVSRRRAR